MSSLTAVAAVHTGTPDSVLAKKRGALPRTASTASTASTTSETSARQESRLENCDWILPNLLLGGIEALADPQKLAAHGVQAVVCCNREFECPTSKFIPELEYYRVDVEDMGREPIELFFPEATEFIHAQLMKEKSVLVHCTAEYAGYTLYDAFFLILYHRPTITPNPGFMERLIDYEKETRGTAESSIDLRKYLEWFQASERCGQPDLKADCCEEV